MNLCGIPFKSPNKKKFYLEMCYLHCVICYEDHIGALCVFVLSESYALNLCQSQLKHSSLLAHSTFAYKQKILTTELTLKKNDEEQHSLVIHISI